MNYKEIKQETLENFEINYKKGKVKKTDINILLNRVRARQSKEKKKFIFIVLASISSVLFTTIYLL